MKHNFILLSTVLLLVSCGGSEEEVEMQEATQEEVSIEVTTEHAERAKMVFQSVPSPFETASIFEAAGAEYSPEYTNPVENVDNYSTTVKQALNLGVYGADLSYANIYDQSQESMFYMNCSKKMADALEVSAAFSPEAIERIEENMNNRDSMMNIVNDSYWTCDAYLKENGQENLSALIILGGWIEGLYLGTKALNSEAPNEQLMKRIADQKLSMANLVDLLNSYDDEAVKEWAGKLKSLEGVFNKVEEELAEATITEGDVPVIGGGSTLKYTPEIIFEIASETEKIRNEIIQ